MSVPQKIYSKLIVSPNKEILRPSSSRFIEAQHDCLNRRIDQRRQWGGIERRRRARSTRRRIFSLCVTFRYTELRVERDQTASRDARRITRFKGASVTTRSWDVLFVVPVSAFKSCAVARPRRTSPNETLPCYVSPSSFQFFACLSRVNDRWRTEDPRRGGGREPRRDGGQRQEAARQPARNRPSPGSRSIRNKDISIISHYGFPASVAFHEPSSTPGATAWEAIDYRENYCDARDSPSQIGRSLRFLVAQANICPVATSDRFAGIDDTLFR